HASLRNVHCNLNILRGVTGLSRCVCTSFGRIIARRVCGIPSPISMRSTGTPSRHALHRPRQDRRMARQSFTKPDTTVTCNARSAQFSHVLLTKRGHEIRGWELLSTAAPPKRT
ncbi:unnamed protein product, partial [Ectocarpus fasciculatus]